MAEPDRTASDQNPVPADTAATDAGATFLAPTLPPDLAAMAVTWEPGQVVGDFVLMQVLGKGAFGTVYLAQQVSLERPVALKVTATRAAAHGEGLALAGLEHDHIVKVFAEFTEPTTGRHCLALQYVAGADLAAVIRDVHGPDAVPPSSGGTMLASLDRHVRGEARYDPRAARDREELARDDFAQAVCRFGGQLAGALAFAHARGVLHCDVKPANILVTPYGRPMLADFNVSFDRARRQPGDSGVGGTLAYMAPEHKAVVYGDDGQVDERSDIYSLGVVLHEMATGRLPKTDDPAALDRVPRELSAVIRRCLDPDPAKRYPTATELADALRAAWALLATRRALPAPGRIGRWVERHAFLALTLMAFLPHLAGSVLNITYNSVEIPLTENQKNAFWLVVIGYNAVVYPVGLWVYCRVLSAVMVGFVALPRADGAATDDLRRKTLALGYWAIGIAACGWFPGGVVFPFGIDQMSDDGLPAAAYAHYAVSFTLSGLVAIVFSYFGIQYVVLRALYASLGNPDRFTPTSTLAELRQPASLFGPFLLLAVTVPLSGAVLLVFLGDEHMTFGFRVLVAGLIGVGVAGVGVAERAVRELNRLAGTWNTGHESGAAAARREPSARGVP